MIYQKQNIIEIIKIILIENKSYIGTIIDFENFKSNTLRQMGAEECGDEDDYLLFELPLNLSYKSKTVDCTAKFYFYKGDFISFAIKVNDDMRISTILRDIFKMVSQCNARTSIFMDDEFENGAIEINSSLILRISAGNKSNNFYLRVIEVNFSWAMNISKNFFHDFLSGEFNKISNSPKSGNRAIKKLITRLIPVSYEK